MPPTVIRLPFANANGAQDEDDEDAASDVSRDNLLILCDLTDSQLKESEEAPSKSAAPAKQRSSKIQPIQPAKQKRRPQVNLATEDEAENPWHARTPKSTPPSNKAGAFKRKRTDLSDSTTEDAPLPAAKKKRRGRKRIQKEADIESRGTASEQDLEENDSDGEWEVERIVGARIEADTYIHWYEVKWKGWSAKHNTWEQKKRLATCQDLIEEFETREQKEAAARKRQDKKERGVCI